MSILLPDYSQSKTKASLTKDKIARREKADHGSEQDER